MQARWATVSMCAQTWGDEDVPEMLTYMEEKLRQGIQVLSNFEKYKKEVAGGQLDWSPMHTSDMFWRENVEKFEERDFLVLRGLLKLLETSREVWRDGGCEVGHERPTRPGDWCTRITVCKSCVVLSVTVTGLNGRCHA